MPAGIIDQTINAAVPSERSFDQIANLFGPGHVTVNEISVAKTLTLNRVAQSRRHSGALGFVVAADNDFRTCSHELLSTTLADTAATAGDDYDFIFVGYVSHERLPGVTILGKFLPTGTNMCLRPSSNRPSVRC